MASAFHKGYLTGRLWPFADRHDFPKADVRTAGFGMSCLSV